MCISSYHAVFVKGHVMQVSGSSYLRKDFSAGEVASRHWETEVLHLTDI